MGVATGTIVGLSKEIHGDEAVTRAEQDCYWSWTWIHPRTLAHCVEGRLGVRTWRIENEGCGAGFGG